MQALCAASRSVRTTTTRSSSSVIGAVFQSCRTVATEHAPLAASGAPPMEVINYSIDQTTHKSHKSHLHVEFERFFSTSTASKEDHDDIDIAPAFDKNGVDEESLMCPVLHQESDPHAMFAELGMKESDLYELAAKSPTPLRLSDMYKYATVNDRQQRLRNSQFLHRELPIRLAQRAVDLLTLPHGLSDAIPIRQVACAYISKLHRVQSMPLPRTFEEEEQFTDLLQSLVLDRSSIPMAIAKGLATWSDDRRELAPERLQEMEDALYRFFTARVGLRFLTEHHVISCHRDSVKELKKVTCMFPEEQENQAGVIHSRLDLVREITRVADLVAQQTEDFYGYCPEIEVVDCMDKKNDTGDFTYVPNHLHYMMGELLKNSCRATVQNFLVNGDHSESPALGALSRAATPKLPPVRVVIVKGDEDVTIKVADKAGGIPRSKMAKIWKFAHSTTDKEENASAFGMDNLSGIKIRGFGLPLCRIYARYLGGDLTLKSMEGYGLDAYLHLPRLGVACENLPRLVRHSPGELDSTPNRFVRNFSTSARQNRLSKQKKNHNASDTVDLLMEELRYCLTQEAKNKRILDFIHSRAL